MFFNKKTVTYNHLKVVNLYAVYGITDPHRTGNYSTLANALFGASKLTKNTNNDNYRYFGCGIAFEKKKDFIHTLVVELE